MDEFDLWSIQKRKIDQESTIINIFPKRREIWIIKLGRNIGYEQRGGKDFTRPVLIIKRFNNHMFLVVPLSTKQKQLNFYYNFKDPLDKNVSLVLAQIRLVSIKRFIRKVYEIDYEKFEHIRALIKKLF